MLNYSLPSNGPTKSPQVPLTSLIVDSFGPNKSKCNIGSVMVWDTTQANNSGSGFQTVTWLRWRTRSQQMWKQDLKRAPTFSTPTEADNQKEWWMMVHSLLLLLTDQDQVSTWDHALAKHITELCMGTTVKQTLDAARTDETMWNLPPVMNYELRKHKLTMDIPDIWMATWEHKCLNLHV